MFHGGFVPMVERVRIRLPKVKLWLWADDGTHPRPDWAADLDEVALAPTAGTARAGDGPAPTGGSSTRAAPPGCRRG